MLAHAESNKDSAPVSRFDAERAHGNSSSRCEPRCLVLTFLVIAFPVLLLPSNAAAAAPGDVRVNVADVDTSTWAGAKEVFRRVRVAAGQLCGVKDHAPVTRSDDECIDGIVARAVYRARLPRLTGIYVNQTGRLPRGP